MKKVLEVCVDSLHSARAAITAGADRLELCSALFAGGLTPYAALLRQIREESRIPIRCLIRPRAGDFLYAADELQLMAAQIRELRAAGADGFVIGCLTPEGMLDNQAMAALIEAADGSGLTLHRAIDVSADPEETYLDAASLGIDTVLTSGCASVCTNGTDVIRRLLRLRDRCSGPEVLIGAGVSAAVIASFRKALPQACAFHMSGKTEVESGMVFRRTGVPMGLPGLDEWHQQYTDPRAVAEAKAVLTDTPLPSCPSDA